MNTIRKVGVIGAGVMGAGIAAQVANAGVPVLLLDVVPEGAKDRNALAEGAVDRLLEADPPAFMSKRAVRLVETGNVDDDLGGLAECDWIIEAIVERLDAKQALYRRIDAVRRTGTAVSSNTSTIPLRMLTEGMPEGFKRDFLITHFFNPPRYMRLLEIATGAETDPGIFEMIRDFADIALGKSIVRCKDTPGFIANRIGTLWLQLGVLEAIEAGLDVETADAVVGRPMGIPDTGIFGLLDLVGLDLMPHVNASMARALPKGDLFHVVNREVPLIARMLSEGRTGRKGKGGFYRQIRSGEARVKEAIDLATGSYRPVRKADLPELEAAGKDLRLLLEAPGNVGRYAWRVLGQTLAYAASLLPEIADDVVSVDQAMRLGYNWKWGPFELIDKLGGAWLAERLRREGIEVPALLVRAADRPFYSVHEDRRQFLGVDGAYHDIILPDGVLLLEDVKLRSKPLLKNASAALWDIGDGVACFEFTSKGNSIDTDILDLLQRTVALVRGQYKALVIYNEGANFSVGANLGLALFAANIAAWGEIEKIVSAGQTAYRALKQAPFPVVSATAGMALGGGCEILLHSDAIQAHAESYVGLVECGVGLLPGWGGCKEMLARWTTSGKLPKGPMPAPAKVFEMISTATVSKSAADAKELLLLRRDDGITMNRDRLLADAKARALAMAKDYQPPEPIKLTLPGPSGKLALQMGAEGFARVGRATEHDLFVSGALADVLSGDDTDIVDTVDEDALYGLERTQFMRLVRQPKTLARVEHTLETGKPLRN
ncbi:MAG: 3-hydroxyacyl-CoA dehydrogenase [Acetobacteraceae bacterium]|nr:3-hydroxyacyl-CoA dehydrogenase [Acetobacteraceae bacterium]